MEGVKQRLSQKDKELLRKFEIQKEVRVLLFKLKFNFNSGSEIQRPSSLYPIGFVSNVKLLATNSQSTDSQNKGFKCHLCNYSGATKKNLSQHSLTHMTHKRLKCGECSYEANYEGRLKEHKISQHNKNPENRKRNYQCQLCSKSFYSMSVLRGHISTHTKEKPSPCQFCSKAFNTQSHKNAHEMICIQNPKQGDASWVASRKRFQCQFCNKKWQTKSELTHHVRIHTLEKPFKCNTCDYAAASKSDVRSHVKRIHNSNRIKQFDCKLCSKMFFSKNGLYSHIHSHTKEIPVDSACEFWKKQFTSKTNRNQHLKTCKLNSKQTDEEWVRKQKKFKCDLCEYSSPWKTHLKTHIMIHTGERPFKCTFCKYATITNVGLYSHLRTHTMEKPHKCLHCEFRTMYRSQLLSHACKTTLI